MEGEIEMETKLCDNCKRDVPVGNYLHHSIHCPRNIRLCPKCDEPYPIIEMDAHIAEDHAEVVCPECYVFMEAIDLSAHQANSCPKRLVSCMICEVELPASELAEHLDYCGSRSDRCDGCGKMVLMKYQAFHLSTRHALTKPENEQQLAQSTQSFVNQYRQIQQSTSTSQTTAKPLPWSSLPKPSISKPSQPSTSKPSQQLSTSKPSQPSIAKPSTSKTVSQPSPVKPVGQPSANSSVTTNRSVSGSQSYSSASNDKPCSSSTGNGTLVDVSCTTGNRLEPDLTATIRPQHRPTVDVDISSSSSGTTLGSGLSSKGPSSATVDLLRPVFTSVGAPANSSVAPNSSVTHSNPSVAPNSSVTHSNPSVAHSNPSVTPYDSCVTRSNSLGTPNSRATPSTSSRTVDTAIKECVNSISAALKVSSQPAPDSVKNHLTNQTSNKAGLSTASTNGIASHQFAPAMNKSTNENAPSRVAPRQSNALTTPSPQSSRPSVVGSSQSRVPMSNMNRTSVANAQRGILTSSRNNNSQDVEEDGARSLSAPLTPRCEVLIPPSSGVPTVQPVNQPTRQKTRRLNYPDDALTEYMHILEEQGLSNGITSSKSSDKKLERESRDTPAPNPVQERAALIRRAREEAIRLPGLRVQNQLLTRAEPRGQNLPRAEPRVQNQLLTRTEPRGQNQVLPRAEPRVQNQVLTPAELRGLNEFLHEDRMVHNQAIDDEEVMCLPCEFCDSPIPMDHLILHQTGISFPILKSNFSGLCFLQSDFRCFSPPLTDVGFDIQYGIQPILMEK
ncbi:hypothetical protein M8J77_013672 [Diaphorina citri]|nr:hypothetical protein M8J77_013672 [Diaphorina citri]